MVTLATIEDRQAIIDIWKSSLTEEQPFIDNYIKHCFPFSKTYIYRENGKVVSIASVLETNYKSLNNRIINGYYLYAVATDPEQRGRGYSREIINHIIEQSFKEKKEFISVYPATESLYELYIKLGFNKALYSNSIYINVLNNNYKDKEGKKLIKNKDIIPNNPITFKEFSNLYSISNSQPDFTLRYNAALDKYLYNDLCLKGGGVYSYKNAYFCYIIEKSTIIIIDYNTYFLANPESINRLLEHINISISGVRILSNQTNYPIITSALHQLFPTIIEEGEHKRGLLLSTEQPSNNLLLGVIFD